MRRGFFSLVLAAGLVMSSVGPAGAVSALISPPTQTHAHNVASHWTGSWVGRAAFHTEFDYGDGYYTPYDGALKTKAYTRGFSPCPGDTTTYYQLLQVWDNVGHGSSVVRGEHQLVLRGRRQSLLIC